MRLAVQAERVEELGVKLPHSHFVHRGRNDFRKAIQSDGDSDKR